MKDAPLEIEKLKDKPWLNPDGTQKSESEIRLSCQTWTPTIWENYLRSLEKRRKEELLGGASDIENFSEDFSSFIYEKRSKYPQLLEAFDITMEQLTKREREIIQRIFWEDESEYSIAKDLKISRTSVQTHKLRALKKIKKLLQSNEIKEHFETDPSDLDAILVPFCRPPKATYRGEYQSTDKSTIKKFKKLERLK